jgi:hypothetical protein
MPYADGDATHHTEVLMKKVQSQLLVSPVTRDRADALSIVRQEPRAEIWRVALEGGGLAALEQTHAADLARLDAVAVAMGTTRADLVARMIHDGFSLADVEGRRRYPARAKA